VNKDVQELIDLTEELLSYVPLDTRKNYDYRGKLDALSSFLSTVGCWIPCDVNNPPPADTPMLVWCPSYLSGGVRYSAYPVWVDATYYDVGEPGKAYTHYMLIGAPE
jgi:hypothetical protein